MTPDPAPTPRTVPKSPPWKPLSKKENLLDTGINKKYQGTTVFGFLPILSGGQGVTAPIPLLSLKK
jgi:hypothetical protein